MDTYIYKFTMVGWEFILNNLDANKIRTIIKFVILNDGQFNKQNNQK